MRSNKNTRAVIVGLFILVGSAIFIVAVLALSGQRKTFTKSISLKAVFDDVNGLQEGGNIWLSGVKIGTVKKISFIHDAYVDVVMDVEQKSQQYIHNDAKAKIGSEGLIGNKIIVIYGGTPSAPPVKEGDVLNVEKAMSMDDMLNTLQTNNKNILAITTDFKSISRKIANGEGTVGRLLNDPSMADNMEATLNILKRTSQNAQALTSNLSDYASRLRQKGTLTNELITDTVVFNRLKQAAVKMDQLSSSAGLVLENMNNATTTLNSSLNNNNTPVGVLLHDTSSGTDLKTILRNMQTSSEKLDQDLEALQHNFLLRGFFKRKAKEKK